LTEARSPRSSAVVWLGAVVAVAAAVAGVWLGVHRFGVPTAGPVPAPVELRAGTALMPPKPLAHFVLTDQDGHEMTETSLRGKWTFAAIGYTTCPDVCPLTMATFVALKRDISTGRSGAASQFLFISVDPRRDTPKGLGQYVHHFDPEFLGATGPDAVLESLTRDLGALYARVDDPNSALGYTVDHSASIYLIDPQARLAAIFSTPQDAAAMARDFAVLLHRTGS